MHTKEQRASISGQIAFMASESRAKTNKMLGGLSNAIRHAVGALLIGAAGLACADANAATHESAVNPSPLQFKALSLDVLSRKSSGNAGAGFLRAKPAAARRIGFSFAA